MSSDEIRVFEGVHGSILIKNPEHLADIQEWMREEDSLQRQPFSAQLMSFERSNQPYHQYRYPFELWIQFYCRSDAVKFKLTFGGKFADIPHVEGPVDDTE